MRVITVFACLCLFMSTASTQEFRPAWGPGEIERSGSFSSDQKIVGTHYFYWYDYPRHHFYQDAAHTVDILQDHYVNPETVSYRDAAWHEKQLNDCAEAGIDFILPVYWGAPDNYFKPDISFSIEGLPPLQLAADRRIQEGKKPIKIGLFYDTSTFLPSTRGEINRTEKYDLRADEGKDIFYRTVRDFYFQIHPRHWATIDGKPIVVLYGAGFAKNHDASLYEYVYKHFEQDFYGTRPYIIRDMSWAQGSDATTQWGAALSGPYFYDNVVQIGAGYNDMAVPGRSTPIRQRENGNFYRWGWNQILNNSAKIVLIETWNEMHEGTSICESREYGRQYIELTKHYSERFKKGLTSEREIALQNNGPVPRPPSTRGQEFADLKTATIEFGDQRVETGIWLVQSQTDGPVRVAAFDGISCMETIDSSHGYMYFSIADPFLYEAYTPVKIQYRYYDNGFAWHALEYDSHDPNATLNGAYKMTQRVPCTNTKKWMTKELTLTDARFVNRENGGSDFRIAVGGGAMGIRSASVSK